MANGDTLPAFIKLDTVLMRFQVDLKRTPYLETLGQYNIRVVEKTIRILGVLSDGKPKTLTEISHEVDINTSTTYRILTTLTNYNFLENNKQSGVYRLGLACLELARSYRIGSELLRVAKPELEILRDETKETVHLAALDGMEIVYLDKLESLHAIGLMSSRVGRRAPAYCTGIGKALLAYVPPEDLQAIMEVISFKRFTEKTIVDPTDLLEHLKEIKARGYALDQGEHEYDVRCVAVPIFDQTGEVIAAVSVSGPRSRSGPISQNLEMIKVTIETAKNISAKLG